MVFATVGWGTIRGHIFWSCLFQSRRLGWFIQEAHWLHHSGSVIWDQGKTFKVLEVILRWQYIAEQRSLMDSKSTAGSHRAYQNEYCSVWQWAAHLALLLIAHLQADTTMSQIETKIKDESNECLKNFTVSWSLFGFVGSNDPCISPSKSTFTRQGQVVKLPVAPRGIEPPLACSSFEKKDNLRSSLTRSLQ